MTIVALALLAIGAWLTTPSRVQPLTAGESLNTIETLQQSNGVDPNIIPGTEERIKWHGDTVQTEWSVVALHGFSATRQETAPLAETVAAALGANLFEARLSGHGLRDGALQNTAAEDWLHDTAKALRIGATLGRKVVVIGTSTGATLTAALFDHASMDDVNTVIMISPNFAPSDENSVWITRPFGLATSRLLIGKSWQWEPHNELQGRFWTTTYPVRSLVEMMRLVDFAQTKLPAAVDQRLLLIYAPTDKVVSVSAIKKGYEQIDAPTKQKIEINNAEDPSHHVLAGDILSPGKTSAVATAIVNFVLTDDAKWAE